MSQAPYLRLAGTGRAHAVRWRLVRTKISVLTTLLSLAPALAQTPAPNAIAPPQQATIAAPSTDTAHGVQSVGTRLLAAYPEHLSGVDGNALVWRDGTRMAIDDGQGIKPFDSWLARPDLEDMLQKPYPSGAPDSPPLLNDDPGRARNAEFFDKMYGDCLKDQVARRLVDVVWLPKKSGQTFKVTTINGVAAKLDAISRALDALPARFDAYLSPSAGTYICRPIAGTNRVSAHGHGIAIDIALKQSDYWRWTKPGPDGRHEYRNRVPKEIVDIFEAHGFIWGGRWYHFDTMHFEYRPELLPAFTPSRPQ